MSHWTITEVAQKFKVSTRTLRYYEELGILRPERSLSNQRLFGKKDLTRLRLIIRGKKFGFSLEQIKEMIILFDEDRTGVKQLEKTIEYGREKILEVEDRIKELQALKSDMQSYLYVFEDELKRRNEK